MRRGFTPSHEGPRAGTRARSRGLSLSSRLLLLGASPTRGPSRGGGCMRTEVLLTSPLGKLVSAHARLRGDVRRPPALHPVRVALAVAVGRSVTRERLI